MRRTEDFMEHNLFLVFIFGGLFSLIAQLLIDLTKLTPARILVIYVSFGVFLYAIGAYEALFEIAGIGVSLPLVGFGANIGRGVKEAVQKNGAIGILEGGLSSSAIGITAALLFGFLAAVFFKSKTRRMGKPAKSNKN